MGLIKQLTHYKYQLILNKKFKKIQELSGRNIHGQELFSKELAYQYKIVSCHKRSRIIQAKYHGSYKRPNRCKAFKEEVDSFYRSS